MCRLTVINPASPRGVVATPTVSIYLSGPEDKVSRSTRCPGSRTREENLTVKNRGDMSTPLPPRLYPAVPTRQDPLKVLRIPRTPGNREGPADRTPPCYSHSVRRESPPLTPEPQGTRVRTGPIRIRKTLRVADRKSDTYTVVCSTLGDKCGTQN